MRRPVLLANQVGLGRGGGKAAAALTLRPEEKLEAPE
jgi:hypothetical protein